MEANPIADEKATPHETLDAKRHSRPQVRVQKIPHKNNPLKQGMVFQIHGAAFMVYEVKSRGRMLVRLMGKVVTEEPEPEKKAEAIPEGEDNGES